MQIHFFVERSRAGRVRQFLLELGETGHAIEWWGQLASHWPLPRPPSLRPLPLLLAPSPSPRVPLQRNRPTNLRFLRLRCCGGGGGGCPRTTYIHKSICSVATCALPRERCTTAHGRRAQRERNDTSGGRRLFCSTPRWHRHSPRFVRELTVIPEKRRAEQVCCGHGGREHLKWRKDEGYPFLGRSRKAQPACAWSGSRSQVPGCSSGLLLLATVSSANFLSLLLL